MKPHTRRIIDCATDRLLELGLSKKRRGLGIWSINSEMWGGINLGHREWPDGTLWVYVYPQVYWGPVQKIYAFGLGEKYKHIGSPTRSRLWQMDGQIEFGPDLISETEIRRLLNFVRERAIPKALELSDPNDITEVYRQAIPSGGHSPEKYLSIRCWQEKSTELDAELSQIVSCLDNDQFVESITKFYARLRSSDAVGSLLTG